MRTHLLTVLLGLCLSIGILYSCKKDEPTPLPEERQLVEEARLALKTQAERDFFDFDYLEDNHLGIAPQASVQWRDGENDAFVLSILEEALVQNSVYGYVPDLIQRYGYPAWSRSDVRFDGSNQIQVAFIPFAKVNENRISAYLMAFKPQSEWFFRMVSKEHLQIVLDPQVTELDEEAKEFYTLNHIILDQAMFGHVDSTLQAWILENGDEDTAFTGEEEEIDFRCTEWHIYAGGCVNVYPFQEEDIEYRGPCPPGSEFHGVETIEFSDDCYEGAGWAYFPTSPGPVVWYGSSGGSPGGGAPPQISYNNHPYLMPIMQLCNLIDEVQSGEVANGQTFSQSDIDRCNQIQQLISHTFVDANDLAWVMQNAPDAFVILSNYVGSGDRTPLQLQGVSAYIRLLTQGHLSTPFIEFIRLYQIVFGNLVPNLGLTEEEGWELFENHDIAAFELSIFLNEASDYNELEYEDAAVKAGKIIVKLLLADRFNGPYNQSYYNILNEVESIQDPVLWAYLFTTEVGFLKLEHPDWGSYRIAATAIANILVDQLHLSLDLIGLIPAAGEVADLTNATIYLIQGDGISASLSASASIPIAGWFSTSIKWARMTITGASGRKIVLNFIRDGDNILFGPRDQLKTVIKPPAGHQAHHIIPWQHLNHPVIQQAAKSRENTFHMNDHINGIAVSNSRHNGSHDSYNTYVRYQLDEILEAYNGSITPEQAIQELSGLINGQLRPTIVNNPGIKINELFP